MHAEAGDILSIITGRITSKGQTTVPKEVRDALSAGPGDLLAWEIAGDGRVRVRRAAPLDLDYLQALEATLREWSSPEDDEAFREL
ncbi:AbrB/MazE/SpoVT family DNA-binding domain-containing protein [Candidatus Thiodictyon syntrophicum]|uniref:AbrB family transcriptional regulator n=1 Tax=Candidatus Thiodictyon syntrophicum TaxID=1166950 RepID=A0A2K8UGV6_9GAMM|nr:type II toxin-antitoxin system PrlF family antitoxin [Candidatus Thiodictyon syntrophicum]AUB84814.1 AbrB family transcriptional regulator [Candidatus Thiodictyon syntrophicum]